MQRLEFAPAKINLTLEIIGRRPDGFHELRSLVAFALDVGDVLTLDPANASGLEATGPFAGDITGSNLVAKAVTAFAAACPKADAAHLALVKNLPVASGIGGGSADAAAALRLLSSVYPQVSESDLSAMARTLGADVPVCIRSRPVVMTGLGESFSDVELPAGLYALLVNPLVHMPSNKTAQVFAALGAPPLAHEPAVEQVPRLSNAEDVAAYAKTRGNDLEAPARRLFPVIETVLAEMLGLQGNLVVQLSGAGPTCFALFSTESETQAAAVTLQQKRPNWWVRPTRLG